MYDEIEIDEARPEDKQAVKNLLQLYQYDFSEIMGGVIGDDGLYHYIDRLDDHWGRPDFHPILVRVMDGDNSGEMAWRLAGFSFVANASYFAEAAAPDQWQIAEFFVMRKYRRSALGRRLATYCFDRFPGRWEVAEVPPNTGAQAFWRRVIGDYTNGAYEERVFADDHLRGPLQTFANSKRNR